MAKKITYEEVSKVYEEKGYELISKYIDSHKMLFVKDKKGYICNTVFVNFKRGAIPNKFNKNNKYTIQNIKHFLKLNTVGYKLLSTKYTGSHEKLIFKCPKGHKFNMAWSQFQIGQRCPVCSGNVKIDKKEVIEVYKKEGYELISEFKNSNETLFLKDKEGYICVSRFSDFKQNKKPSKFHSSNSYTIQNINLWTKINAEGYELLSTEYKNAHEKLLFKCPEGHEFKSTWNKLQQGHRCPICSHHQVSKETSIYAITPWMMDLGVNEEDAKKHLPQSSKRITVICPNCGKIKKIQINQIYQSKSISCTCGDGVSYPEKFIISLLNQLGIKYIKEYSPEWVKNKKRYDFYLPNYNSIIECHGEQHYKNSFTNLGARTLQEEQENDQYKKQLALNNGISNYIELDCRESNLSFIKNSILNSELNNMFNLNKINWLQCEEFALGNLIKKICNYWNNKKEEETTRSVGKIFNLDRNTICRYLKKGQNLGWCNYNPKKENAKSSSISGKLNGKPVEIFKNGNSLGVFPSCAELERQSEKLFGVKLLNSNMCSVCNGKKLQYKGYTFKYITKEEYESNIS